MQESSIVTGFPGKDLHRCICLSCRYCPDDSVFFSEEQKTAQDHSNYRRQSEVTSRREMICAMSDESRIKIIQQIPEYQKRNNEQDTGNIFIPDHIIFPISVILRLYYISFIIMRQ